MTLKKHTISLDGLLAHESIIFKLICSVSERTKNRTNAYSLTKDNENSDIKISDIKNQASAETQDKGIHVWVADKNTSEDNIIARPLIATRVLHTLDNLIEAIASNQDESKPVAETPAQKVESEKTEDNNIEFNISEEEASELAIVHDEILENPANKEEVAANNVELTLVKNETPKVNKKSGVNHVLVVDDSLSVRKQLELELDLFDVTVDYAETAQQAFDLLKTNNYDLALLDVVLPDKDGFLICKHIKATSKETIAIMLTGKATPADKIKGSLAGCDDYLIKPVGRITFQNAVKNYIPLKETNKAVEA